MDKILISAVNGDVRLCDWSEVKLTSEIWTRSTVQPEGRRAPEAPYFSQTSMQITNRNMELRSFNIRSC